MLPLHREAWNAAVIHGIPAAGQTETVRLFHVYQEDEMSISISVAYVAEIERLRRALQVIETWARMEQDTETRGSLVPSHVVAVCRKALEGSK